MLLGVVSTVVLVYVCGLHARVYVVKSVALCCMYPGSLVEGLDDVGLLLVGLVVYSSEDLSAFIPV